MSEHRDMRVATYHGTDDDAVQIIAHQHAEIERLTSEIETERRLSGVAAAAELRMECERLRAAPEYYADVAHEDDCGTRARAALGEKEGQ